MLRILILVPAYVAAVTFLPQLSFVAAILDPLIRISGPLALGISASALLIAVGILHIMNQSPVLSRPVPAKILMSGLVGVVFSGLFDIFAYLGGGAITLSGLAIVPAGFLVAEAIYQAVAKIMGKRGKTALTEADAPRTGGGLRLMIVAPVYVFILVFLPQQDDFRRLTAPLLAVRPVEVFWISIGALVFAAGGITGCLYLLRRGVQQNREIVLSVALTGCFGLGFAGLLNAGSYIAGIGPVLAYLIIIPVGTMVAELIYLGIDYRLNQKFK